MRRAVALMLVAGLAACTAAGPGSSSAVLSSGPVGASSPSAAVATRAPVGGCRVFPADSWWHADVSDLPVHTRSAVWMRHMSPDSLLHPDFGPSYGDGPDYGIPVTVVAGTHPKVGVRFDSSEESDHVGYPFGDDTRIEGGRRSTGDRHAVVVDKDRCKLYETWATRLRNGHWRAGSGATWDLRSNALRTDGWTSADAAGLPVLPGLLRWREVRDESIDHAIRFTTDETSQWHLWPARHDAGSHTSHDWPPMGARFRLAADFDTRGYGTYAKRVIAAMQTYGLVLADNGSPWYFQGEQNGGWPESLVEDLKQIPATAFEAVDTSSLQVDPDSGQVR